MLRTIFLFLLILLPLQSVMSQGDNRRGSTDQGSSLANIFVDEIGIRLINEGLFFEGELDPDNYILGPLDALSVTVKGSVNLIFRGLAINPVGDISIPSVGAIRVSGLSLSEARLVIQDAIKPVYANSEIITTLDIPRNIVVHLLGDVPQPGVRFMPAFSRLNLMLMSLFAEEYSPLISPVQMAMRPQTAAEQRDHSTMGSIGDRGDELAGDPGYINRRDNRRMGLNYLRTYSLRNINILHADGSESHADLLGYYFGGMLDRNPVLKPGDRVIMQFRRSDAPRVSISGAVNRPFNAEYYAFDTLGDLLQIAGGLSPFANEEVGLLYLPGNSTPTTLNLAESMDMPIQPNSRIIIKFNEDVRNENSSVWTAGEVLNPGNYPIEDRVTTLRELLEMAGGFTHRALPQAAYISRKPELVEQPELRSMQINNRDMINRTSPLFLDNVEYLELEQRTSLNIIHIDLRNEFALDNTRLHANDRIIIPQDQNTVTVFGQVNNTGFFPFWPETSVDDYIMLAGGPTLSADTDRIYIIKAGTNVWFKPGETRLESGDKIFIDRIPVQSIEAIRTYELELVQQRNNNLAIVFAGLGTISSIATTIILLLTR